MTVVAAPLLLVAALLLAWLRPQWMARWERTLLRALRRPLRPGSLAAFAALTALTGEAATALVAGLPLPRVHDEFSYLLAADTFARGRLANPTHPLWRHFETFHVLVQPTYGSKYPPGQGLFLALGELLGQPILGVWLSGAAFAAAAAWMLQGWLRPPWARLATFFVTATLVVGSSWSHDYWGGFLAAAGGALLFGAAVRLRTVPSPSAGLALGVGLVALAYTRPWEGAVATAAALLPVASAAARRPALRRALLRRAAPAALAVGLAGAGWLGWYQFRVTGSPWRMPYRLYDERYEQVPIFLWQPLRHVTTPVHPDMARFFRYFEGPARQRARTLPGWCSNAADKVERQWSFYLELPLSLAVIGLPWAWRRPGPRWATAAILALMASQLVILPSRSHYLAPGAVLVAYAATEGWRQLRLFRPGGHRLGATLAALVPLLVLLTLPLRVLDLRPDRDEWYLRRAALARSLAALPGKQLVLVRYGPAHDPVAEWVFDDADLRGTRVLWARSMGDAEDCELVRYERDRASWVLMVVEDITPPWLRPFPTEQCAGITAMAPRRPPARTPPAGPRLATAR